MRRTLIILMLSVFCASGCGSDSNDSTASIEQAISTCHTQPPHAWFEYPAGQTYVNIGQSILVAAAGVLPGSKARFVFYSPTKWREYETDSANGNCVVNQEYINMKNSYLPTGNYEVRAYWREPVYGLYMGGIYGAMTIR